MGNHKKILVVSACPAVSPPVRFVRDSVCTVSLKQGFKARVDKTRKPRRHTVSHKSNHAANTQPCARPSKPPLAPVFSTKCVGLRYRCRRGPMVRSAPSSYRLYGSDHMVSSCCLRASSSAWRISFCNCAKRKGRCSPKISRTFCSVSSTL
jgi:hypothetical protein